MARNVLLSLVFLFAFGTVAIGQNTSLQGKVSDQDSGEPILFGNVALYKEGNLITGVETDFDGNYIFSNIDPGTYDVEASYVGYQAARTTNVVVYAGKSNILDLQIGEGGGIDLEEIVIIEYREPLIEQDNTTQGSIVTSEEIRNLPTRSINGLASTSAGVGSADDGDDLSVRGSRTEGTIYYVDGIQVRGNGGNILPESEIDQLQIITGGVDASYGDVTGGVISITTKGPSSSLRGGLEAETSELFDNYGYNLLRANVSGPILKRKMDDGTENSILGFRLSAQYRKQTDDDAPALPVYVISDEARAELEANPLKEVIVNGLPQVIPAGQELTFDDMQKLDYRPNETNERLDFTAKLDARLTDAIDITLSGTFSDETDMITPGYGESLITNDRTVQAAWRGTWTALNSHNNPTEFDKRYRGNFRFRHKLGRQGAGASADGEERKASTIQNASYILQFGYEKQLYDLADSQNGDNLFGYGHVGQFDYEWTPVLGESEWSGAVLIPFVGRVAHADYRRDFVGYTPGQTNPVLANYNNLFQDTDNDLDFELLNGTYVGTSHEVWGFHDNIGTVYNLNRQRDRDYYTFKATSSFDIVPNGNSDKGRHSIQFGINYEQRFLRGYDIAPRSLWEIARQQVNRHLQGVDTLTVLDGVTFRDTTLGPGFNELEWTQFAPGDFSDSFSGNYFFRRVRDIDGTPINQFFNVDKLNPDQLSLDMFSAQELNDATRLSLNYYGYDYTGNKLGNDVGFDDFFTSTDAQGVRDFPIGSFQPIYAAAYIQDKFTFRDIIFRLGLRVDRYDANTKVLKDPFTLYEGMNAKDFYALSEASNLSKPNTIGDDYTVYVSGDPSRSVDVTAYRDGEQWYNADGTAENGGNFIFGGEVVTPRQYAERVNSIRDPGFDINNSFKDYEPQVNWMPRLAFSFPISDEANFFAHYDILVQRPSQIQALTTPLQYFYMEERSNVLFENPNLKPQRTVDYEVGFQQKLSNSSALKIAAYYKEMRDMIQRRTYGFVASPVNEYVTFDNQDFGTVKGFSLQYDMRRTNNVTVNATYTLQFADGTGSDADSQAGLTSRGNLRTLFPLNFDERHRVNVIVDYRYSSGKNYNGPTAFGNDIFANAGINVNAVAVSGRPYSKELVPDILDSRGRIGSINGSRLPWNYWLNLKIDKQFTFTLNKDEPNSKKRNLGLNVYFRVQNLLDQLNVINVYQATGSPADDGYLTSSFGEDAIRQVQETGQSLASYQASYQWRLLNPTFYSLPRRMYLGAAFNF